MTGGVFLNGDTFVKYICDAAMARFGHTVTSEDIAPPAVVAALSMRESSDRFE